MKKILVSVLCLWVGLVFADPAAVVLFTQNNVFSQAKNGDRSLSRGSALSVGDTIITQKNALVNIRYSNGTLVNLGENSRYSILSYAPNQASSQMKTQLSLGKAHIKTIKKTNEEITTPITALAILGTELSVYVNANGTYVQVSSGVVEAKGTVLKPGDSALINRSGLVSVPFPKEGNVVPPAGSEGSISAGGDGSSAATSSSSTTSTDTSSTAVNTTETVVLTTTDIVGTSTASSITASTTLAELAIICPP